jgi:hypothetical protein
MLHEQAVSQRCRQRVQASDEHTGSGKPEPGAELLCLGEQALHGA